METRPPIDPQLAADDRARAGRLRDHADYIAEMNGWDNRRTTHFQREDDPRSPRGKEQRAETYSRMQQRIAEITRALDMAFQDAARRVRETQEQLERMREQASRDARGRVVWRSEDKIRAFYDDGTQLTEEEAAAVQWKDDAPTWEQRQEAGRQEREARERLERIGEIREAVRNGDLDPETIVLPEEARRHLDRPAVQKSAAHQYMQEDALNAPDPTGPFNTAARQEKPASQNPAPAPELSLNR